MTTRREKARELWQLVLTGPRLAIDDGISVETRALIIEAAAAQYAIWANQQLIPLLQALLPELREQGWFANSAGMSVGPFESREAAYAYAEQHRPSVWKIEERP